MFRPDAANAEAGNDEIKNPPDRPKRHSQGPQNTGGRDIMWDDLMEFVHRNTSPHLQLGQATGWAALVMSSVGAIVASIRLMGAITPDGVNQWALLIGSVLVGGASAGCLIYAKIVAARQSGETLETCHEINRREILAGRPPRFPALIPREAGEWFDPTVNGQVIVTPKEQPK